MANLIEISTASYVNNKETLSNNDQKGKFTAANGSVWGNSNICLNRMQSDIETGKSTFILELEQLIEGLHYCVDNKIMLGLGQKIKMYSSQPRMQSAVTAIEQFNALLVSNMSTYEELTPEAIVSHMFDDLCIYNYALASYPTLRNGMKKMVKSLIKHNSIFTIDYHRFTGLERSQNAKELSRWNGKTVFSNNILTLDKNKLTDANVDMQANFELARKRVFTKAAYAAKLSPEQLSDEIKFSRTTTALKKITAGLGFKDDNGKYINPKQVYQADKFDKLSKYFSNNGRAIQFDTVVKTISLKFEASKIGVAAKELFDTSVSYANENLTNDKERETALNNIEDNYSDSIATCILNAFNSDKHKYCSLII